MFTDNERAYLQGQRMARLATVSPRGIPDVAPVAFTLEDDRFVIGGVRMRATIKYHNVRKGAPAVAIVVDDIPGDALPGQGKARGIKIHGTAEIVDRDGEAILIVTPERLWSWGIEAAGGHGGAMRRARWES